MSEQPTPREQTEEAVVQVDLYGIKADIKPTKENLKPKTWKQVWRQVHSSLKSLAAGVPGLLEDLVDGARRLVRGLSRLPDALANRIDAAHRRADAHEVFRQRQSAPTTGSNLKLQHEAVQQIAAILDKYRAAGHRAEIHCVGGKVFLLIGGTETREVAADIAQKLLPAPEATPSSEAARIEERRLAEVGEAEEAARVVEERWHEMAHRLNESVSKMNPSVRARKLLNRLGISTLGELVQRSADELLEVKGFGMATLTEVREKLKKLGLALRGD